MPFDYQLNLVHYSDHHLNTRHYSDVRYSDLQCTWNCFKPVLFRFQHVLADAWVVKSSELGMTEDTIHCRTYLGHLLQPGDVALG